LQLAQWFWRRRFLNDHTQFSHFWDYLPLEEGKALCLHKLDSPSPKDDLYQVWMKLAQWFWRRKFYFF
jgi:diadenosine tetraphosphatase ApaH/serine/threonine PP2A family protein phosphatase